MVNVLEVTAKQLDAMRNTISGFKSVKLSPVRAYELNDTPYAVKINNSIGMPYTLSFKFHNGTFDMHYEISGSSVMMRKVVNPFDFSVKMDGYSLNASPIDIFRKPYRLVKTPRRKEDTDFLFKEITEGSELEGMYRITNIQYYILLCNYVLTIFCYFPYVLNVNPIGEKNICTFKPNFIDLLKTVLTEQAKTQRIAKLYDGWDVIRMTDEQFDKVAETVREERIPTSELAFNRICLRMQTKYDNRPDIVQLYYFSCANNVLDVTVGTEDHEPTIHYSVNVVVEEDPITGFHTSHCELRDTGLSNAEAEWLNRNTNGKMPNWEWIAISFFMVNAFMLNYQDVATDVEERECLNKSEERKPSEPSARGVVRLFKTYTLKKAWKTSVARKHHEIHCPAWGVKGHFRHYKSGKVVFIAPFVKGKEKGNYRGKDYILPPTEKIGGNENAVS